MTAKPVTERAERPSDYVVLGVVIGVVMPVVAALCYPTYVHLMPTPWVERTRLAELPFVLCELVLIQLALRRGYADRAIWDRLPQDVRWASGLLLVGLTVSSLVVSRDRSTSIALSLFTLVHLRFAAAAFFMARAHPATPRPFMLALGAGLIALAALTAWKFALPPPAASVPGGRIEWGSALPGFINVRHFGAWTGAIAAGLMLWLLYGQDGRDRRPIACLYLLAAGMTCWSGTRAAVLAMVVVAIVAALTLRRLPDRRPAVLVGGLSAAALACALLLAPAGQPDFMLYSFGDGASANAATGGRLVLWRATLARWLEAPLFGWGSGSTFWEVYVGWSHTQPHNVVLQFLISWGLVGAAGGLWLLVRAIGAMHRFGMSDDGLRPLAGLLYALLFQSLLEGMLHYPRFIMVIMVGFAVILAKRDGERAGLTAQSPVGPTPSRASNARLRSSP